MCTASAVVLCVTWLVEGTNCGVVEVAERGAERGKGMGRTSIKIEGFAELRKRAEKLEGRLKKKVYGAAVRAGGKVLVDAAKGKVPVRTGAVQRPPAGVGDVRLESQ